RRRGTASCTPIGPSGAKSIRPLPRSEGLSSRRRSDLAKLRDGGAAVLTVARIRELHGDGLAIFRELGYEIAPVAIEPAEWRRAGIAIGWNGASSFSLAALMRRFDLFHLRGEAGEQALLEFLKSYREYNVLTKSVVLQERDHTLSVYDLSSHRKLRR